MLDALVGGSVHNADTVVSGHNAERIALSQRTLKGAHIDLADGLLVRKGGNALTTGFLLVQEEVLDRADQTLVAHTAGNGLGSIVAENAVLGEILRSTTGVGRTQGVRAGRVAMGMDAYSASSPYISPKRVCTSWFQVAPTMGSVAQPVQLRRSPYLTDRSCPRDHRRWCSRAC